MMIESKTGLLSTQVFIVDNIGYKRHIETFWGPFSYRRFRNKYYPNKPYNSPIIGA